MSYRHQTGLNEPKILKIGQSFLVDIGVKEKGKVTQKVYISPYCSDVPFRLIYTKFARVPHMNEVIKCAKFGLHRFIGVRSAGSQK